MTPTTQTAAHEGKWYLGSLNDGLFITDTPPSPAGTDIPADWGKGCGDFAINVSGLSLRTAMAIVDAHNAFIAGGGSGHRSIEMNAHEGTPRIGAHTAGPWGADEDGDVFAHDGAVHIAHVLVADEFPCLESDAQIQRAQDECEANARLIAAAPLMLETLRAVLPYLQAGEALIVRNAIARATGAPQP